ncbi:MAG: ATP-binding cassette domain-containing protein, partial [Schleiferiaceae bacterium]|nr:ATP-binding cassette domain-containing protein [Schleiferiaceae bacterium]
MANPYALRADGLSLARGAFLLSVPEWSVAPGEVVALYGPSGSGKSTLLSLLAGQVFADSGDVWVGRNPHSRDRLIAGHPGVVWVKQDFGLSPYRSVRDNLLDLVLGKLDGEEDRLVRRMMRTLGLGMDPSRPAHSLSGGEQQRLSIGRALLGRPRVLLLDEPFSHVDGFHKERLLQLLTAWQRKTRCTVVLVAHDVRDAARWAHRIDVLQDGRIVESGSGAQLFAAPRTKPMAYAWGPINELPWARVPEGLRAHPHAFRQGRRWFLRPEFLDAELLAQTCGSMSELERWTEGGTTYVRASAGGLHW